MTVMPSRMRHATLGIARAKVVLGRIQAESCAMVTPERMLMSNLPAKASFIPLSLRMVYAPCGLQLDFFFGGARGAAGCYHSYSIYISKEVH